MYFPLGSNYNKIRKTPNNIIKAILPFLAARILVIGFIVFLKLTIHGNYLFPKSLQDNTK